MSHWSSRSYLSQRLPAVQRREYRRAEGRASLDAAIAGLRESAYERAEAIRAKADAAASAILHEAEAEIARLEAEWAIASHHPESARLLKPKDAADFIGVGVQVVYALLRDETLPSVTIGTRRYIHRAILEEYVDELAGRRDPDSRSLIAAAKPPAKTTRKRAQSADDATPVERIPQPIDRTDPPLARQIQLREVAKSIAELFGMQQLPNQKESPDQWYEGNYLRMCRYAMLDRVMVANELTSGGPLLTIGRN